MITCHTDGATLVIEKDPDDEPKLQDLVADVANSSEIDVTELENEGAPVYLGNDYAEYQLAVLMGGTERRVGIGPKELWALLAYDRVEVPAYS